MEREPIVSGKNLKPEAAEEVGEVIREFSAERGTREFEGEIEKTPEELAVIKKLNSYIAGEMKELGVKEAEIRPEQVHFLTHESFEKNFSELKAAACCDNIKQAAFIDRSERPEKMSLAKSALHEMIHLAAFRKFIFNPESGKIDLYRTGYGVKTTESQMTGRHDHFKGLDEAVVDKLAFEIIGKHAADIKEELGLPVGQKFPLTVYRPYLDVLDKVIEKVAAKNGETEEAVWRRFKKGLFTGEMMHLRDVERTFGKGALRLVGAMGSATKGEYPGEVECHKIIRYFETEDEEERQKIVADVLDKRERFFYLKRRGEVKLRKK